MTKREQDGKGRGLIMAEGALFMPECVKRVFLTWFLPHNPSLNHAGFAQIHRPIPRVFCGAVVIIGQNDSRRPGGFPLPSHGECMGFEGS
jgi:hypothetical protein